MPAIQVYPTPSEQLVELARAARDRSLSFEEFWEEALRPGKKPITTRTPADRVPEGAIIWPHDSADRRIVMEACADPMVHNSFKAAYEHRPPSRSVKALASLR